MTIERESGLKLSATKIDSGWTVRELPRPGVPGHTLLPELPAHVPGYVHLDLMRNGIIDDPFKDLNEKSLGWIDETDWEYSTTFHCDVRKPGRNLLVFDGLDTVAEILLNGEPLANVDNMHRSYEFEVGDRLRYGDGVSGTNLLSVTFRSATRVGRERQAAWNAAGEASLPTHWDNWSARSFVRKAQYMYGWDWGPVLPSCGIWRDVKLVNVPVARITGWKHAVRFEDGFSRAIVDLEVEVERAPGSEDVPLSLSLKAQHLIGPQTGGAIFHAQSIEIAPGSGSTTSALQIVIENPALWQPKGLFKNYPALYYVALNIKADDVQVCGVVEKIGLRAIELIRTPDADGAGEGFNFRVNGVDIFAKGANWIPDDSFLTRRNFDPADDEANHRRLWRLLKLAAEAGINMIRVWGGGIYESNLFYNFCDELGILVWQDFLFGCAYYPDNDAYCEEIRAEATENVRRIRHHPSIALWCGNNENQVLHHDGWAGTKPPRFLGERLYEDVLPAVVAAQDPATPYWPGSPYGAATPDASPNSPDYGDRHNWDVWHGIGDWTNYAKDNGRFISEFGFASSCGLGAWEKWISPEHLTPYSPAVRWHDKTRKGYETYLGMVELHFPKPQTLEDLVYYTQLNQAEALKFGIEHYRRLKGRCWGTLFWQLNDCWPVQSWAVIDNTGEPKAAYWAMRKFYAPVLVSLVRDGNAVHVHMVSDRTEPVYGELTVTLQHFDGSILSRKVSEVELGANSTTLLETFDISDAAELRRETVVRAVFVGGDGSRVENALFLAEPKDLRVADPGVTWRLVQENRDRPALLHITAQRFAPYVWLSRRDNNKLHVHDDNFFHLFPGETRTIKLGGKAEELVQQLVFRWL